MAPLEGEEKLLLLQAMGSIWMIGGVVTRLGAAEDCCDDATTIESEVFGRDAQKERVVGLFMVDIE